jgi:hypothetical protein
MILSVDHKDRLQILSGYRYCLSLADSKGVRYSVNVSIMFEVVV